MNCKAGSVLYVNILILVLAFSPQGLFAQRDSVASLHHQLSLDASTSFVFQTNGFFKGENSNSTPIDCNTTLHLKYGFQFPSSSLLGSLYPGAYQGIGVSYTRFNNPTDIGSPVSLYLYQGAPILSLSSSLSLGYEWNFGASFGWRHYNAEHNAMNKVVGSSVNAYINLGFYLRYHLSSQWTLRAGIDASHFSNGNTHYPNAGVNTMGVRMGIVRTINDDAGMKSNMRTIAPFQPSFLYDLTIYAAPRFKGIVSERYVVPGSFATVGVSFSPLYNVNRYLRAGMALDAVYDESSNLENHIAGEGSDGKLMFYRQPLYECFSLGVSARAEFVMPIFSINVGIGHNLLYHGGSSRGLYQLLSLKSCITRSLYLNVGYKLSRFHDPEHLMIGLGYRFHNMRMR